MRLNFKKIVIPTAVLLAAAIVAPVQASTVIGSGMGFNGAELEAQATFDIAGDILTITLKNIATNDEETGGLDTPTNTLTGLFFDITGAPILTTVSATVAGGSAVIQPGTCAPGPCAGATDMSGEWGYSQTQDFTLTGGPNAGYGIASPGYLTTGLPMNIGNFNDGLAGPNLDDPNSLDGINFGLVSSLGVYNPNVGLLGEPLVQDTIVFMLSGATGLTMADFTNVNFQYGTGFDEPLIPPAAVPVPASVWLFGSGLLGLVGIARRRCA